MRKIRSQRALLNVLLAKKAIAPEKKRFVYLKIKGNSFRNKRAMVTYLKDNGLLAKEFELEKNNLKTTENLKAAGDVK
jgi:ribosomal protein L19E